MKKNSRLLILSLVTLLAVGGGAWWYSRPTVGETALTLYGNIDFRQASVPFNGSERIAEVLVEEGAFVKQGQILATLDTRRLQPQLAQLDATVEAQKAVLERLLHGTRKEEIAQAKANLESAKAEAVNANTQYKRRKALEPIAAVSQQDIDQSKATAEMARAKVKVAQNALTLAILGPRTEDIAQAKAQLRSDQAHRALLQQQLQDAQLRAPFDAIVQARLMEAGEIASPSKPVFSLAAMGTKWVRAYVPEPKLSLIQQGAKAKIFIDSMPGTSLEGWVGFISPVAEFTPKTVQTEDLRTSLVYETRIFVPDRHNVLRLGMPATVKIQSSPRETSTLSKQP